MPEPSAVWAALTDEPLDVGSVWSFLQDERAGGTCLFIGSTRRWTGSHETQSLSYEAYAPMASAELERLASAAADRWGLVRAVALHRLGDVPVAEPSVIVGAASPHRAEAFEAARWLIDELKADVPIWKTDHAPASALTP